MKTRLRLGFVGLALIVLAQMTATAGAQTVVRPGFNIFSVAQDVEIGRQSALQVERQIPMLNDPAAQRYVSALGTRLAARAPGTKFNYQFKIANLSDLNAFALPGGYIYVHRGLLEQVRSEGELAGVLAHEIAHVSLRHPTNQASKAYLAQAGLSVLGGLLGRRSDGSTIQIVNAVGGFGLNTLFLKFSRSLESQADVAGSQIMAKAGYDPMDMARFFAYMGQKSGSQPSKVARFLSDHPAPADREARVRQEAALLGAVTRTSPVGSLAGVQDRLRRHPAARSTGQLASGAPATQSTTAQSAGLRVEAPSSRSRIFNQPQGNYQIQVPDNWSAHAATGDYGVTLVPRGGVVEEPGGRANVAYGVIVNHYVPFDGSIGTGFTDPQGRHYGFSLEQATTDLVREVQQSNPHLQRIGSTQRTTISGQTALVVRLRGRSSATGGTEQVTVVTRELSDGHVVYALMIAPSDEYAALEPTFNHIVRSLRISEGATHN